MEALDGLDAALARAVRGVAEACARDGRLDGAALDAHQAVTYDLALSYADLLAAREAMAEGRSTLDASLGRAFAAEVAPAVLARLEGIYLATGL